MASASTEKATEVGLLGNGFAWAETKKALTVVPAPGPALPGSGSKGKTFHSLPWKAPHLREAGCYLKVCKRLACFSSWSGSFRTISIQFQSWNGT